MITLKKFLLINNIKQVYFSEKLNISNKILINEFKLKSYNDPNENTLFFGIYEIEDYSRIFYHKGKKWLLFEGNDLELDSKYQIKLLEYTFNINLDGYIYFNEKKLNILNNIKPLLVNPYY